MIISVAMFSLLLIMMIDVVRGTSLADEAYYYLTYTSNSIDKANELAEELANPDAYYIGTNKEHLIEQIRARVSMTQLTIDELAKLYVAKFGDTAKRFNSSEEFDPDDQEKAKQLVDKLKESSEWFKYLLQLSHEQNLLKKYYSQVEAYEKFLQDGFDMLDSSPKIEHKRPYLDGIRIELNKVKQALEKVKSFFVNQLDNLNADMVDHDVFKRFLRDKISSDYVIALKNMYVNLDTQCRRLHEKLHDELLLAESDNDESDDEKPQDDEPLKKAKAELRNRRRFLKFRQDAHKQMLGNPRISEHLMETKRENLKKDWNYKQEAKLKVKEAKKSSILASNTSGSQENQQKTPILQEPGSGESQAVTPVIPIKVSTQSSQEDQRPFWKKKRYYIPASAVAGAGILFTGWLLDLHNIIPQMIGWGSKEDDSSSKVNPPNSTTTDTSTDAPNHQVEYLTVVIIVLVALVLLVVGFVVLLKGCKNGTSDLELGKPSHKSQAASTMTSTITGTETPLTPTRSTNATSSKAKSKKDSPGTVSTPVSTKTKSKRSSQK